MPNFFVKITPLWVNTPDWRNFLSVISTLQWNRVIDNTSTKLDIIPYRLPVNFTDRPIGITLDIAIIFLVMLLNMYNIYDIEHVYFIYRLIVSINITLTHSCVHRTDKISFFSVIWTYFFNWTFENPRWCNFFLRSPRNLPPGNI